MGEANILGLVFFAEQYMTNYAHVMKLFDFVQQ